MTENQKAALAMLAAGVTPSEVPKRLGISGMTMWRWRKEPEFSAALREQQEAHLGAIQDRLLQLTEQALTALDSAMDGQSDSARVQAARTVLDRVLGPVGQAPNASEAAMEIRVLGSLTDLEREAERRQLGATNGSVEPLEQATSGSVASPETPQSC